MEDYLEAIAWLKKERGIARVKDIAQMLKVKNSSVNAALKNLSKMNLVMHERYGHSDLTAEGASIACEVQGKHDLLVKFLCGFLKVSPAVAMEDACRMEHVLSPETLQKLTSFTRKLGRGGKSARS